MDIFLQVVFSSRPLKYFIHRVEVVFLDFDFDVANLAITLRRFNAIMAEQVLDGYHFVIDIEQLGGHILYRLQICPNLR